MAKMTKAEKKKLRMRIGAAIMCAVMLLGIVAMVIPYLLPAAT